MWNVLVSETQRFQCKYLETTLQVLMHVTVDASTTLISTTVIILSNVKNVDAMVLSLTSLVSLVMGFGSTMKYCMRHKIKGECWVRKWANNIYHYQLIKIFNSKFLKLKNSLEFQINLYLQSRSKRQ